MPFLFLRTASVLPLLSGSFPSVGWFCLLSAGKCAISCWEKRREGSGSGLSLTATSAAGVCTVFALSKPIWRRPICLCAKSASQNKGNMGQAWAQKGHHEEVSGVNFFAVRYLRTFQWCEKNSEAQACHDNRSNNKPGEMRIA